jgi:hypothetical protein
LNSPFLLYFQTVPYWRQILSREASSKWYGIGSTNNTECIIFISTNEYCHLIIIMTIHVSINQTDWLIIYGFTSHSRIFHLYGDVIINGEGLQNLGLCLALRAFEQEGIFIMPHLLWHGTSDFPVSSEWPPHSVAFYDVQGDAENLL